MTGQQYIERYRRNRLRKVAAGKDVKESFKDLLQNRHFRTGVAGLSTAALAKLLGAGWGTSLLLGGGAAAAAHFGQKAYDKWDAQRKYDALSDEEKIKLELAKQDRIFADARVLTDKNKQEVERKRKADESAKRLAAVKAETSRLQGLTAQQLELEQSIKDAEREEQELAADVEADFQEQAFREATKRQRVQLAKINSQLAALTRKDPSTLKSFKASNLLATPYAIINGVRNGYRSVTGADSSEERTRLIKELNERAKAIQKDIDSQRKNY